MMLTKIQSRLLLLLLLVLPPFVLSQTDEDESFLFVTKQTINRFIVQDKELTIQYGLYNSGPTTVFNVQLNDVHSFPKEKFELLSGTLSAKWERINAGANLTHVVVVKPKQSGISNSSHAIVNYRKSEKSSDAQTTYSSEIGTVYIMTGREYDRRFSSHIIDWILFTAMASPCIGFPFFLWFKSKSKYEKLMSKDKSTAKKAQ
jgi:translocon-associated protein subunit beta